MYTICLLGAGKIGHAICGLLSHSGRYHVRVGDLDETRATAVAGQWSNCTPHRMELENDALMLPLLQGCDAVLSALPFFCNPRVATLARKVGIHYLDLTEDVAVTKQVLDIAAGASSAFLPQCGLAPGFISIAAAALMGMFDELDSVKLRVGALPVYPNNALKYNLTWSTEGLINEYGNLCEAIVDGKLQMVQPLEGYERFVLDGVEYEAFNTSGGLGSLAQTLLGKVKTANYRSLRHPGHRDLIHFLMNDLGFTRDRESLRRIFERSIPTTSQDVCVIYTEVRGRRQGVFDQKSYVSKVYSSAVGKHPLTAIQITTAAGICAPLDLLLTGKLGAHKGFLKIEEISLSQFLENEFGRHYRDERALAGLALNR